MKIQKAFYALATTVLIFWILWMGQSLLLPLVIAFILFYIINLLSEFLRLLQVRGYRMPRFLSIFIALLIILAMAGFLVSILTENINAVIAKAPDYQRNFNQVSERIATAFHLEDQPTFQDLTAQMNFRSFFGNLAGALASIVGSTGFILVYLLFFFLEQVSFQLKIQALFPGKQRQEAITEAITEIKRSIQRYLGLKTFTSALTGVCSYFILLLVGIDFASFWAVLIFLFNYIPTVGSIVATLFPALLALFQFPDQWGPFFAVLGGVGMLQILIGNFVEPRIMGTGLGLSPLIIILSLTIWGTLWGIAGAILAVPITVILTIILAKFSSTRPIAIVLSRDGKVSTRNHDDSSGFAPTA